MPVAIFAPPAIELAKSVLPPVPAIYTQALPTTLAPRVVIKPSGFENTETPITSGTRPVSSAIGAFDSATPAAHAPARGEIARRVGFSDSSSAPISTALRSAVTSAAFGDTSVEKNAAAPTKTAASRFTAIEILAKPKPAYTAEARAKKMEGEVLLEVQFGASGELRVLRVFHGLGAGLDESAEAAARGIRFHPATRDGTAVDTTAIVHIVFQIAN